MDEIFFFRVTVPVEKCIHPKYYLRPAYFSEYYCCCPINAHDWSRTRGLGGTISGIYHNLQELQCKPCNIENHDVITQETVRISTEAAATAATTTLQKTAISEEARISDGDAKRWKDPSKPSNMYLVLPSYTEPQNKAINKIIADEKAKLCSNSLFKQVFANIDFRIAFANSKNIKKLIVRTKV